MPETLPGTVATTGFVLPGYSGEIVRGFEPVDSDLESLVERLADPSVAEDTIHWGRNYLYRTRYESTRGGVEVVVKQFNHQGFKNQKLRQLRGSKALRSWRAALTFQAAGVATAEPILLIESKKDDGPSFFVTRHLSGALESRVLFRAANQGREREEFPEIDYPAFLHRLGTALRRMHEAGLFHRDLSIGNVLISKDNPDQISIIDLNRMRQRRNLSLGARNRDLCRLAIFRPADQRCFLEAYWGGPPGAFRTTIYKLYHHGFLFKIESKKRWRSLTRPLTQWLRNLLVSRGAHAHIPEAPEGSAARDKIVWDHLSDQPHHHASRFEKTMIRLADFPSHALQTAHVLWDMPGIWRRYRRLRGELYQTPVPWDGVGICVRPYPEDPNALLAALDDLGVKKVLLRLHPWDDGDEDELKLARALHSRGYELAYALPQNRDLVRDPERWRRRVAELADTFVPYGKHFQVGQAVNRSKWGIWTLSEYAELARIAAQELRRHDGVQILGPAVIDFEYHATIAALRLAGDVAFDAVASLLYVDRRGAPENSQLGFDTVGKIALLQAIAEQSPGALARSWVTEVNWPLWEGPHSPAGRSVSVDEDAQADYLARYYLLALTTGMVERVYWWQLMARGYGLIAPQDETRPLRRRASFEALATLNRELHGTVFQGPLPAPPDAYLFAFQRHDGGECVAGWCMGGTCEATLPWRPDRGIGQQGEDGTVAGPEVKLRSAVQYFHHDPRPDAPAPAPHPPDTRSVPRLEPR